jgi:hypothetical protein
VTSAPVTISGWGYRRNGWNGEATRRIASSRRAPRVRPEKGEFFARGTVYGFRADYQGTVSGETMRLKITSYPPTSPEGFVILSVTGYPNHNLTYGVSFIEKQGSWGCICPPPCVGCPP